LPELLPRLLFDENLAARLVTALAEPYPGSVHVRDAGLAPASDRAIWEYAREHGLVIVSKDEDYPPADRALWRTAEGDLDPTG
jgi:predicted nuclease of predicted toxin-antitoxin system